MVHIHAEGPAFSVGFRKCILDSCCAMKYKIAVAGTDYVGLSIATLLSQHHQVTVVDIVQGEG